MNAGKADATLSITCGGVFVGHDVEAAAGEAVFGGVLRRGLLTGRGGGAGGFLRILAIGLGLCCGAHGGLSLLL